MAIPTIDDTVSILAFVKGQYVEHQFAASDTPTSWAISAGALPTGMDLDTDEGLISGTPTAAGAGIFKLTATNGSGTSAELEVAWGVESIPFETSGAIELDVDLYTGIVTNLALPVGSAPLYAKRGDKILVSIGFRKQGVLMDLPIVLLNAGMREYDDEGLIYLNDGGFEKVGDYDSTRYTILLDFTAAEIASMLSNYEDGSGTYVFPLAEIEWTIQDVPPGGSDPELMVRSSRTFAIQMVRDIIRTD